MKKTNATRFIGGRKIQQEVEHPSCPVPQPSFPFSHGLWLVVGHTSECFSAFPPPHSAPVVSVFLHTALKNECAPALSTVYELPESVHQSRLVNESATQKWPEVSIFYEPVQTAALSCQLSRRRTINVNKHLLLVHQS